MASLPSNPSEALKKLNPHIYGTFHSPKIQEDLKIKIPGSIEKEQKLTKRIRQSSEPLMNKLETEYYSRLCGIFGKESVKPQALRLKLANGCWYKGDFAVFCFFTDGFSESPMRIYEVKGPHAFRGGFENLKVAAHQYPQIQFILAWKDKETKEWREQIVLP